MVALRFLPQPVFDAWTEQGKTDFQSDRLIDLSTRIEYPVVQALRFVKLESGEDSSGLLDKVKRTEEIRALGAEHYMTSVILGDTVYEVEPGWIAEEPAAAAPAPPRPASKKFESRNQDADLLAKLLLDKLS